MQHLDTDIDLDLDDRDAELVYETNGWNRLVHGSITVLIASSLVAVVADATGHGELLWWSLLAAVALFPLVVFALVMEYRADHR